MVYLTADWHGNVASFQNFLNSMPCRLTENDIIVILGDCGIMYGNEIHGSLRKKMKNLCCKFIVMRGNHDKRYYKYAVEHPERFVFETRWDNDVCYDKKYPNIFYVRDDAAIYNIDGNNILFIPGAYSVDKAYRLAKGWPWEPDEQLDYNECCAVIELVEKNNNKIDYIFSHTCPRQFQYQMKDLLITDYNFIVDNSMEKMMDIIFDSIGQNIKGWYWGHYHGERDFKPNAHLIYHKAVKL